MRFPWLLIVRNVLSVIRQIQVCELSRTCSYGETQITVWNLPRTYPNQRMGWKSFDIDKFFLPL
jgi:hypothetical protein